MKIYRFSIFLVFVTAMALFYVHQQVQLLKISYKINANEKNITTLLDRNETLIYNVTRLKSPVYLENKFLATEKGFVIPKQWQVVKVMAPKENQQTVVMAKGEKKSFGILKMFGKPTEAMANPIK